ncbi:Uma2 family endonuclease [Dyadobacter sandarakinus]|uniref:Uma2 family endonuclease n=1 Tax=Dyadobacter sandarakinus TaxID=2747268 RepID=A0ABX7IBA8_9BACT|nr:Uma2 family endonuclease [Dyadobacter sandarakinus]QRR03224.1 Uma2 family endonuclease [Dyadobacter sandarakinus]
MIATPYPSTATHKIGGQTVPNVLIHEVIDGKPLYRKGYREVLAKTKAVEDIMGSSSLQFYIIEYLLRILFKNLEEERFIIATNEAGIHIDKRNNIAGDILIYEKDVLTIDKINKSYAQVPPKISLEVDLSIELEDISENAYINLKTKKLLDFGTEKVIWFLTESRKVIIARPNEEWIISNWDVPVHILDDITCNIGAYLKEKGSEFA